MPAQAKSSSSRTRFAAEAERHEQPHRAARQRVAYDLNSPVNASFSNRVKTTPAGEAAAKVWLAGPTGGAWRSWIRRNPNVGGGGGRNDGGDESRAGTRPFLRSMTRQMSTYLRKSNLIDSLIIGGGGKSKADMADFDVHAVADMARATADAQHLRPQTARWFLVSPYGRHVAVWDAFTSFVLLCISIFTPFEVAFLQAATSPLDPLFLIARFVDLIFLVDMGLQFVLMIPKEGGNGKLETEWGTIAAAYLHPFRGWFLLDAFALAASSFDFVPLAQRSQQNSELSAFRAVRILRLVKLARLLKASQRLKEWSVKVAMPRSTLTILSCWVECLFVMHWFSCVLGLLAGLPDSPLDSWLATHGFCTPREELDSYVSGALVRGYECVPIGSRYMQCFWWSAGMLMGAPISLSPNKGPYARHFSGDEDSGQVDNLTLFTTTEQVFVIVLKTITAFEWVTVLARFVQVYNNLDPDTRDFRAGWDALNRFINYFKVAETDALELRRYYIERSEMAKAKSRKRVMNDFSPHLAEKFVWKLNKGWLMRVPCFSLVVDRLLQRPDSGMERYLVKVALAMQPEVYVPTERPPALRLYIVTSGVALHRGRKKAQGDSWGAEDVLMKGRSAEKCFRALAVTYLHTLWIGVETFEALAGSHREAFSLTKLWAVIHAAGDMLLQELRAEKGSRTPVTIGNREGEVPPADLERKINRGALRVVFKRSAHGQRELNSDGKPLYTFKHRCIDLDASGYELTREAGADGMRPVYRLRPVEKKALAFLAGEGRRPSTATTPLAAAGGASPTVTCPSRPTSPSSFLSRVKSKEVATNDSATALSSQLSTLTSRFQKHAESHQAMALDLAALAANVEAFARRSAPAQKVLSPGASSLSA